MNHYPIQSKRYFKSVKSTRGDAYFSDPDHQIKNMSYFKKFDRNDIVDDELACLARREERSLFCWAGPLRRVGAALGWLH